ncbi:MAG: PrsW family glutamic-type intramembrane protease [Wenzhouxiangellaceae bacterium]
MSTGLLIRAMTGLLPVACFLAFLLYLDSYKLVRLRLVLVVILGGAITAGLGYFINIQLVAAVSLEPAAFSRYIAPVTEEVLKALIIVWLIRAHRVGFLVDAAIFGFAVGTGFAVIENLYYLGLFPEANLGTWIVRGFGTAIMHGGATAIFALIALTMIERGRKGLAPYVPGFVLAVALHSAYNHFFLSPIASTVGIIVVLPPLMYAVFQHSEKAVSEWLGTGFDDHTEMLELINSGQLSDSPIGHYLHELRDRFHGPVVADLLCYLRLHTELALRAKGILMMREAGLEAPVGERTRAKFAEMRYLEKSIGPTGRLALKPVLYMSHKELWQLYMLGK